MINMNDLLLQIILASRSDDVESWMNILFIIVLAVFWLIGGIIKAKANKAGTRNEQSTHSPYRRPPVHSKEAREQMLRKLQRPAGPAQDQTQQPRTVVRKPRIKFAELQSAVRKFAVEAEQAFQANIKEPDQELESIIAEPNIKVERVEFLEPIDKTFEGLQDKQGSEPSQVFESEYLSELITDYSDPDRLRRAILNYEILGKPLSLRNTYEKGIGE
jgi:hypothetical protein